MESPPILPSPAANVSIRGSSGQYNRGRSSNCGSGGDSRRGRGRGCAQGRGRDQGYFQSSSCCQVCNRHGHIALNCYHRFNQAYQSDHPPSPQVHMVNSNT